MSMRRRGIRALATAKAERRLAVSVDRWLPRLARSVCRSKTDYIFSSRAGSVSADLLLRVLM